MTPLEKAAGVIERGTVIASNDCKTLAEMVIRAFLEAAAEDAQIVRSADIAFWQAIDGREPPVFRHGAPAKAAILALKETL
jgi:hypothetical protein